MKHTEACDGAFARQDKWTRQWPEWCAFCKAHGFIHNSGHDSEPPSDELCKDCLGKPCDPDALCDCGCGLQIGGLDLTEECGHCPRCGQYGINTADLALTTAIECPNCGWASGAGADDYLPELDCHCGEWKDDSWTAKWPTTPGYYWFYGWPFRGRDYEPEMLFVKVIFTGDKRAAYVTMGTFIYESDSSGKWMSAVLPTPPEVTP